MSAIVLADKRGELNNGDIPFEVQVSLTPRHVEHLLEEGFKIAEIAELVKWGVKSISSKEAKEMGFGDRRLCKKKGNYVNVQGLYFPNHSLRLDYKIFDENGKETKYLFPKGKEPIAWSASPDVQIATEGFKDGVMATLRGYNCLALTSVTCWEKQLPNNSDIVVIYDADAKFNPNVLWQLLKCAIVKDVKINFLPSVNGFMKAGMCEFFKFGYDLQPIIDDAKTFDEFVPDYIDKLVEITDSKVRESLLIAIFKGCFFRDVKIFSEEIKALVSKVLKIPRKTVNNLFKVAVQKLKSPKADEEELPNVEITQVVFNELFKGKKVIRYADTFYEWQDNYYKEIPDVVYRHKIAKFLNSYYVLNENGEKRYPYAFANWTTRCINYIIDQCIVDPEIVQERMKGINCKNCVVRFDEDNKEFRTEKHDALLHYFFSPPTFTYNPEANPEHLERLLKCLPTDGREIFLRTASCAIDLGYIRKHRGRLPKALFLYGTGNNGKDTLRELLTSIIGDTELSQVTVQAFQQHDQGRPFGLMPLATSKINWCPETNNIMLDNLQSLKAAITGEPISTEKKGKDGVKFKPEAVFFFNINQPITVRGTSEAIDSRYAVLNFPYTFKNNPNANNPNELKADIKFKDDSAWVLENVVPAFLNLLLMKYCETLNEGIDYTPVQNYFKEAQETTSHLIKFINSQNIVENRQGYIVVSEIWDKLQEFYVDEEYKDEKGEWLVDQKGYDSPVTSKPILLKRLQQLFVTLKPDKVNNQRVYKGIAWGKIREIPEINQSEGLNEYEGDNEQKALEAKLDNVEGNSKIVNVESILPSANESILCKNEENKKLSILYNVGDVVKTNTPEYQGKLDYPCTILEKQEYVAWLEHLSDKEEEKYVFTSEYRFLQKWDYDGDDNNGGDDNDPSSSPDNFKIVKLEPKSEDYAKHLEHINSAEEIVLDVETFSECADKKAPLDPSLALPRLIQVMVGDTCYYADLGSGDAKTGTIDLFKVNGSREKTLQSFEGFINLLAEKCKDLGVKVIGHNLTFDLNILTWNFPTLGFEKSTNIWDTKIGLYVFYGDYGNAKLNGERSPILEGGYSLKNGVEKLVGIEVNKAEQTSDWGTEVLSSDQILYACKDCLYAKMLYEEVKKRYSANELKLWELENSQVPISVRICRNGFPFSHSKAENLLSVIAQTISGLEKKWNKLTEGRVWNGKGVNLTTLWIKEQFGIENITKEAISHTEDNEILLIFKQLKSLESLQTKVSTMLIASKKNGKVHSIYDSLSGIGRYKATGSSVKSEEGKAESIIRTNVQSVSNRVDFLLAPLNLPSVRQCFGAEKGKKLIVIDLPAAHARLASDFAKDENAIVAFNDPSIDNHSKVAVFVAKADGNDWSWDKIAHDSKDKSAPDHKKAKLYRGIAKNTFYGFLNGAGSFTITKTMAKDTGVVPDQKLVESAINGCKKLYPNIVKFQKTYINALPVKKIRNQWCSVNVTKDGFRVIMPSDQVNKEPQYANNLAVIWTRVEATAMKKAIVLCQQKIDENPQWKGEIVAMMHDEIDFQVSEQYAFECAEIFNNIIGDCFAEMLTRVSDGRETDLSKLICDSWADKA